MLVVRGKQEDRLVIYERGEPEFDQAWEALVGAGKEPKEWMYMDTKEVVGLRIHGFKNIETRRYVRIVQILEPRGAYDEDLA